MNITIVSMERESATGAVKRVDWVARKGIAAVVGGTVLAPDFTNPGWTPYEQLTEDQVRGWVTNDLGMPGLVGVETALDQQLAAASAPQLSTGVPWDKS